MPTLLGHTLIGVKETLNRRLRSYLRSFAYLLKANSSARPECVFIVYEQTMKNKTKTRQKSIEQSTINKIRTPTHFDRSEQQIDKTNQNNEQNLQTDSGSI